MERARWVVTLALGAGALLTGCSSMQEPRVEEVARTFTDPAVDPAERCDLLAPTTLAALEEQSSCAEAVEQLVPDGGAVTAVEVWGGDAQVRLTGDTVFLAETGTGWRVVAAACQARDEAPYDCEVEGP
ncbi:UNVERIFIED_ORG: hypothetical protein E4P37_00775 [Bacillus sp. AZ43]